MPGWWPLVGAVIVAGEMAQSSVESTVHVTQESLARLTPIAAQAPI